MRELPPTLTLVARVRWSSSVVQLAGIAMQFVIGTVLFGWAAGSAKWTNAASNERNRIGAAAKSSTLTLPSAMHLSRMCATAALSIRTHITTVLVSLDDGRKQYAPGPSPQAIKCCLQPPPVSPVADAGNVASWIHASNRGREPKQPELRNIANGVIAVASEASWYTAPSELSPPLRAAS